MSSLLHPTGLSKGNKIDGAKNLPSLRGSQISGPALNSSRLILCLYSVIFELEVPKVADALGLATANS
ncbi:hypothetical protein MKW98_018276 [Papaver atlanticum]|uniref:Uncharacterized protein n=1 Tax=Papaver atlanticum TaxID=357466 RepID=A0AAD4S6A1_9MAGN|nr:hypothetical protein MKW98_018276 [Papaver atlanticum]